LVLHDKECIRSMPLHDNGEELLRSDGSPKRAGGRRRNNDAAALRCQGGAFDGSERSFEVGWCSTTCAREWKGCEEGCLRWAVAAETEELVTALTEADRRAMAGRTRCKEGALL
jgi:hypothetical protein